MPVRQLSQPIVIASLALRLSFAIAGILTLAVAGTVGCSKPAPTRVVTIELPSGVAPTSLVVEPASAVIGRRVAGQSVVVTVRGDGALDLSAPAACPKRAVSADARVRLEAMIALPEHLAQVGWDRTSVVTALANCDEADKGRIEWREVEGALAAFTPLERGFSVRIHTEPFALEAASPPWGIVPISPRTRGSHLLEATWIGPGGERLVRRAHVSAMARASGVPSIAKGQEVLLGGAGWHVVRANPKDAVPTLEPATSRPDLFRFRADVAGQFQLVDGAGAALSIRTNTHEHVPLDCGRGECHASVARDVSTSPMTHVLRNGLEGTLGDDYDPGCAVACHAVGEPGLGDEGFVDVQRALGFSTSATSGPAPHAGLWDELPRALRRLGGVGCTSCHGPATIPEPAARFTILRADVCATCHDAPPRYAHVSSWRTSAMARSDRDPEAASDAQCQRCHTTAGFLRTLSNAPRETTPDRAGLVGIACAACHTPHGSHGSSLVREVAVPPAFASLEGKSRICVACHENDAAGVWLGDSSSPSPHAALGCASCHLTKSGALGAETSRGASHDFRAGATCRACHPGGVSSEEGLRARAQTALDALARAGVVALSPSSSASSSSSESLARDPRPPHARRPRLQGTAEDQALVSSLLSVIEDRAALVHNARFVKNVVERAEVRVSTRAASSRP